MISFRNSLCTSLRLIMYFHWLSMVICYNWMCVANIIHYVLCYNKSQNKKKNEKYSISLYFSFWTQTLKELQIKYRNFTLSHLYITISVRILRRVSNNAVRLCFWSNHSNQFRLSIKYTYKCKSKPYRWSSTNDIPHSFIVYVYIKYTNSCSTNKNNITNKTNDDFRCIILCLVYLHMTIAYIIVIFSFHIVFRETQHF